MSKTQVLRATAYIPWLTGYAVITGALYLWGFWSKFHLNILEYIGVLDLAVAAALPLFSALVGIVGGAVIAEIAFRDTLPRGEGSETSIGRFLNRRRKPLLVAYLVIVLVVFPMIGDRDAQAFIVPIALVPVVSLMISETALLSDIFINHHLRFVIINILTVILFSAFGHGRFRAVDIAEGTEYLAVSADSLPSLPVPYITQSGDFKYLGHAGEYFFVLAPDASLLTMRADTTESLVLNYKTSRKVMWPWK